MADVGGNSGQRIEDSLSKQIYVTKCLIECIKDDVDGTSTSKLEIVFSMVTRNLVFDDPGLFANFIILDEKHRQIQDSTVMWLIHQVLYVCNKRPNMSLQTIVDLQKNIIAASYMKQPDLFNILILRYIAFTRILIDADKSLPEPLIVSIFKSNEFDMTTIVPDCEFKSIEITKIETLRKMVYTNVRLLKHAIMQAGNNRTTLTSKCNDIVLDVFRIMELGIKTVCVKYFYEFFVGTEQLTNGQQIILCNLLEGVSEIQTKIDTLKSQKIVHDDDIKNFVDSICMLLESNGFIRRFSHEILSRAGHICLEILRYHFANASSTSDYNPIVRPIVKFLNSSPVAEELWRLFLTTDDSKNLPGNLTPVSFSMNQEPQQISTTFWDISALKLNIICSKESGCHEEATKELSLIKLILSNARSFEHLWQIQQQIQLCEEMSNEKFNVIVDKLKEVTFRSANPSKPRRLFSNMEALVNCLLKKLLDIIDSDRDPISLPTLVLITEICVEVLTLSDGQDMEEYTQLQFQLLALCPLMQMSDLLSEHIKQEFANVSARVNIIFNMLNDSHEEIPIEKTLSAISNLNIQFLSSKCRDVLIDIIHQIMKNIEYPSHHTLITKILINCLIHDSYSLHQIEAYFKDLMNNESHHIAVSEGLKTALCLSHGQCIVFYVYSNGHFFNKLHCQLCECDNPMENNTLLAELNSLKGRLIMSKKMPRRFQFNSSVDYFKLFQTTNIPVRYNMTYCIPALLNHFHVASYQPNNVRLWLSPLCDDKFEIRVGMIKCLKQIPGLLKSSSLPEEEKESIINTCLEQLLAYTRKALLSSSQTDQSYGIQFISSFASSTSLHENKMYQCFCMLMYFLVCGQSLVSREALLVAKDLCSSHDIITAHFLAWNKTNLFKVIIPLCVSNYLQYGTALENSLTPFIQLVGYKDGKTDFISEHYGIMLALLIPFAIKIEKCMELIDDMCEIVQKDLPSMICGAFLSIYTYLYLNEKPDIYNKCMDFLIQNTGNSLYDLLKSDIKRTTAEILVYYHMNPDFVMNTFRNLLHDSAGNSAEFTTTKLVEYITPRFLGVICHFEQILINEKSEKSLKQKVLLSLGEIIRFMGSDNITKIRFKLLAVLHAALNINPVELRSICLDVWKIFISTVHVIQLGSLLSTIFVSLEPLLETHPDEVNDILRDLIIRNGNVLSVHIPELYFVKGTKASADLKEFIATHTERIYPERRNINGRESDSKDDFMLKFKASIQRINHDNVNVRIYGLNYLTELFERNRMHVNELIIGRKKTHSIIENLLDTLMIGIRHFDEALQIATGRCVGKLGALEPSHLSPNYSPERKLAPGIYTNEFAIMALKELCKAYQSQKDTKNVDVYSLAIQEILVARKVWPAQKRNMDVWQAIPERMRPLIEPMLTSCYALTNVTYSKLSLHPIFGSHKCRTFEEWALTWATKNLENISDESIKSLFRSFKLCMRYDLRMLSIFLPYIILHALQSGDANCLQEIVDEMNVVFKAAINPKRKSSKDSSVVQHSTIRRQDFTPADVDSGIQQTRDIADDIELKCAKLAFNQLDFIEHWLHRVPHNETNYNKVKEFTSQFDKKLVARANFACGEYARALMYLETYIEGNRPGRLQEELSFLSEIYAELMDSDSLEGALNLKDTEPTLGEQIRKNNVQGRLQDSVVCFERMMHVNALPISNATDMVQCYLGLNQPETAILLAEGLMKRLHDQNTDLLLQSTAEPLWRLGRFEELEDLIENADLKDSPEWGIRCGQILLKLRKGIDLDFVQEIEKSRLSVMTSLRIVGDEQNLYHKGYSNILKLHFLSEIEQAYNIVSAIEMKCRTSGDLKKDIKQLLGDFLMDWDGRLQLLQPSVRVVEPVLCLRRIVLNEVKSLLKSRLHSNNDKILTSIENHLDTYIGKSWIRSAELARDAGMYQQADLYILNAESYKTSNLFVEKAKLFWKKGDQTNTYKILNRGIEELKPAKDQGKISVSDNSAYAEAKFLMAVYNAESLNVNSEVNVEYFKEAYKAYEESEKCMVHYAQYLEKALAAMPNDAQFSRKNAEHQNQIIYIYMKSMLYGTEYVYQSMPRVLSIWLDFTVPKGQLSKREEEQYRHFCQTMNTTIEKHCNRLPIFVFYTAFSQLVSRICHPSLDVYAVIKTIIINLIIAYPQQSMWMILSVHKSSYASRVRRCNEIFSDKRLKLEETQKLISDFNILAERLIELTNKELPSKTPKFLIRNIYPALPHLLAKPGFSQIILPLEKYMHPTLPTAGRKHNRENPFNVFPNEGTYIVGIKDEVFVLPSLQRPRRITLLGNDGSEYIFMMKPKDDLRRDFRLMEFNAVVKQYLHQHSDARQRRLYIRTYAVMPLNEECGILEWVSNLTPFRQIIIEYQKQRGISVHKKDIQEGAALKQTDDISRKREWLKRIIKRSPPVFGEWFKDRFTTPHNWYQARSSYIRTAAVMSIVGYILGLGDRHGENILLDSINGDVVHVDFNCLFNKGESFEIPEVVPFRLTQNMVHAMGPLGVEGQYRKCCEITLKVLQDQMPTLMSVLRPFVYDPLFTWSRNIKQDAKSERTDSQAMENVRHIEERLKGYVKINGSISNIPLSAEGVVNHCIETATDIDRIASMYVGWGPYL